jgi:Mn2+/Fe2+ NRAMP family transporter
LAEALRPLAGDLTFVLFALGIIGTGLLAVPVLAGSAAYCVAEAFGWHATLEAKAPDAVGFYSIIAAATVVDSRLASRDDVAILFVFGKGGCEPLQPKKPTRPGT